MKKMINKVFLQGYLYEYEIKETVGKDPSKPSYGVKYLGGDLKIALDEEGLNIVTIRVFEGPTNKNGTNDKYKTLEKLIQEGKTWLVDGKENATKLKISTSLQTNDFVNKQEEMISAKQLNGGFINIVSTFGEKENEKNHFEFDMLINSTVIVEPNPEKGIMEEFLSVRGAVFTYKNEIQPVDLVVKNPQGINVICGLNATSAEPVFIKVWGRHETMVFKNEIVEESGFGEANTRVVQNEFKQYVITGIAKEPYVIGDPASITTEEIVAAMQNREVHLAGVKSAFEAKKANQGSANAVGAASESARTSGPAASTTIPAGGFTF